MRILPRDEHIISRANISENALKVLYRLNQAGHEAYLVGGGVRDLLLGKVPKDFDVATSATPDEVKDLFRNCRLIGRRFRLAHIRFGREIIEVATFRAHHDSDDDGDGDQSENGMILRDNVYGTRDQDAVRRDFTVNCLYYDVRDFSVIDFASGVDDLNARLIRVMGDPVTRYREDPVRILRAARFAAKLDFDVEDETRDAIDETAAGLEDIPAARLFEEVLKLFMTGHALASFEWLRELDVFRFLFPATDHLIDEDERALALIEAALRSTDTRIAEGKPVTPAFLLAAILWPVLRVNLAGHEVLNMSQAAAIDHAGGQVFVDHYHRVAVPKRFSLMARDIWALQPALEERRSKRTNKLLGNPRLRAAYDFLLLRAEAGEPVEEQVAMWTKLLDSESRKQSNDGKRRASGDGRRQSGEGRRNAGEGRKGSGNAQDGEGSAPAKKRRRRRRRRKPSGGQSDSQPAPN